LHSKVEAGGRSAKTASPKYYQPQRLQDERRLPELGSESVKGLQESGADSLTSSAARILLPAYLVSLLIPIVFRIGPVAFTGSRIFLSLICLPVLASALGFRRFHVCDALVLIYTMWAGVCFVANQGISGGIEPFGSHFVEVAGGYFLARVAFQNPADYEYWAKCLFLALLILLPLAISESLIGRPIVLDFLSRFVAAYPNVEMPLRFGLDRAQTVFEHPILHGVFCASALSPVILVVARKRSTFVKSIFGTIVGTAMFLSFSTGAYLNFIWQLAVMLWNRLLKQVKHRWRLLGIIAAVLYVIVDVASNRTPFEVFITYFTFDLNSAYSRVLIWKFGTAEVFRHPIFGMGLFDDWVRPPYMGLSVDNFWLLRAMRFGFPGVGLLLVLVLLTARSVVAQIDVSDKLLSSVSLAQLCALFGLSVSLVTVDIWSGSHTVFFFALGSIVSLSQYAKDREISPSKLD
jgi:O-Antigen ligase